MSWFFTIETVLAAVSLLFFFWTLAKNVRVGVLEKWAAVLGLAALASAFVSLGLRGVYFAGTYEMDPFSQFVKVILVAGYFIALLLSRNIQDIDEKCRQEFYLFLTTATLGMCVLVSAKELITLYVGLELSSYSLYLLIPMRKREAMSAEAGIKYLLMGVASSGVMIYGFSLLLGLTQTTYLGEIASQLPRLAELPAFWAAFFLSLVAFFFKLSLFPLHFWAPDIYEGGNTQVVGFIATVSKVAGLAVLIRFVMLAGANPALLEVWILLAIASMTLGNLAAILQGDLKRMLAYSSIAQAGYLLVGVLCQNEKGLAAAIFYSAVYVVMNFAAFFIVTQVSEAGRNVAISQMRGLSMRSPLLALTLMVSLFSLAGVPPLAGFTGKWFLFATAVNSGYKLLAIIAIANSVISLYYYLMVIKEAYTPVEAPQAKPLILSSVARGFCVAVIVLLAVVGFLPGLLMPWVERSVAVFF